MPFLSCCHSHSTHCDGKHSLLEMLTAARDLGFVSMGFSGHSPQGFPNGYSMSMEAFENYLIEARRLQKLPGYPRVWVGAELDTQSGQKEIDAVYKEGAVDYVMGSTHYLPPVNGEYVAVDGPVELLKELFETHYKRDGIALARDYYEVEGRIIPQLQPDIIGHFDLVRKYAGQLGMFEESNPAYRKLALDALEQCFQGCKLLEVNTGGMARGYLSTPYPTLELLCAWREMGGEVTIASDCHDYHLLDYGYEDALRLIRQAGYGHVMRLGTGDELWDAVALED